MVWDTDSGESSGVKPSLVERGRKRKEPGRLGKTGFLVTSEEKFGDSYEHGYTVSWSRTDDRWFCTCQEHKGGEYRTKGCSHIGAVVARIEDGVFADPKFDKGQSGEKVESAEKPIDDLAIVDPSFPLPLQNLSLPEWVSDIFPHQHDAVNEILEKFDSGKKIVFLDAPTGSGKTLIAELVRQFLDTKMVYTCSTKTLQEQFLEDFPYSRVIKGRSNYPTELAHDDFWLDDYWAKVTADDCTDASGQSCVWCNGRATCPYQMAKVSAKTASVAVLNTAYALAEMSGSQSNFAGRGLMVLDECDVLESSLMGHVEVRISPKQQAKYGIQPPTKKTVKDSWIEWVADCIPKIVAAKEAIPEDTVDKQEIREAKRLDNLLYRLYLLRDGLPDDRWVYTGYKDTGDHPIIFKPVFVDDVARWMLWDKAEKFLCMSASIISPHEMADSLGLQDEEWDIVYVPSTFPAENRPIYVSPVANVTNKNKDAAWPQLAEGVEAIHSNHSDQNILVHTVSYQLAQHLHHNTNIPTLTYDNAASRDKVLQKFRATTGNVLLAPSLERGVDLPGDLCRVVVVCKAPYPNIGDKQVSERLHSRNGQLWYRVQTVRALVQSTGRGVRNKEDWCVTYCLDKQVSGIYKQNRKLFPSWWKEGVISSGLTMKKMLRDYRATKEKDNGTRNPL